MIALFILGAAQVIRAAPVAPRPIPPVSAPVQAPQVVTPNVAPEGGQIRANLLPDLVVSEVRVEDDTTAWFKVTNQGTADAVGDIRVSADAYVGSRRGGVGYLHSFTNLASGESKWVEIAGFAFSDGSFYPGRDYSVPLTKVTEFSAYVDPPVYSGGGGWFGSPDPSKSLEDMLDPKKPACNDKIGCIRELHEDNNGLKVDAAAIGHGKPE